MTKADKNGWQPIETAPAYDESPGAENQTVLLFFPGDVLGPEIWMACAQPSGGWCGMDDIGLSRDTFHGDLPTHWQPLPEPPEVSK